MTLPVNYKNPTEYFTSAMEFLKEYAWIYKHSNTTFLKAGVLDNFPKEFKDYFLTISNEELNKFPFIYQENQNPNSLKDIENFKTTLQKLTPLKAYSLPSNLNTLKSSKINIRKMSLKKQHETCRLAELINKLCCDNQLLIDFGAGLGYLSEMIYTLSENKFLILGLESEIERVHAAEKRREEYLPSASQKIVYKKQFITEASLSEIAKAAEELYTFHGIQCPKMAIVGLHSCADLTITAMKIFFEMGSTLSKLIIMPCCYHKMEMNSDCKFRNFPLSQALKDVLSDDPHFSEYLNRPFLRLACQQTLARWGNTSAEEHASHGLQMFQRGIADAIIDEDIENVVKRKETHGDKIMECLNDNFGTFSQVYELKSKITSETKPWTTEHKEKFEKIVSSYPEGHELSEGLTCLQTTMQKLCENIVLFDRLCYMKEYASTLNLKINVRYEKLLDEKLSPRCYVLIAEKL